MKRSDATGVGVTVKYARHTDEAYEQELKSLLKSTGKGKSRSGTSSGSGGNGGHQSFGNHNHHARRTEHIERIVLETDTLPGLALLYNTTVSEIKKLNHIYTEQELHARRTIKVPSRGILISLDDPVAGPSSRTAGGFGSASTSTFPVSTTHSINISPTLSFDESEINANDPMTVYLNTKDNFLQEIREKADVVAANSPILNGSSEHLDEPHLVRRKGSTLKWWHLLIPCLGFVILFPILLFLFQEHLFEHVEANHTTSTNATGVKVSISPSSAIAMSPVKTINNGEQHDS